MNPRNFFAELKRRNVIRMAGLYLVGAWLLVQVAGTVLPMFGAPDWLPRSIVILLAIGFIPAIIFAWAFELTPSGLKRDEEVTPAESIAPQTGRRMDRLIIAVLVLALAYFCFDKIVLTPRREAALIAATEKSFAAQPSAESNAKSIAVLPFENLSADKDNAYFADGVQDEILARLAKVADLKVISRTSTQRYKSSPDNLREIAKQLGVVHILEGSVQKAADQVRVNVQLINATTDAHVWAEIYDRKMTDIFAVESDIAKTIAENLRAKLTGAEQSAIAVRPTENSDAHEFYLRGRYFAAKRRGDDLKRAIDYFNQAITKDANYAPAYAGLADSYVILPEYSNESAANTLPKARAAAEKALALDDNLAEAHVSLGLVWQGADLNIEKAGQELRRAIELNPSYADAHYFLAILVLHSLGQFDQAIAEMKRAIELDPFSAIMNANLGYTYSLARRYPEAVTQLRKTVELDPNFSYTHIILGMALVLSGDLPAATKEYEKAYEIEKVEAGNLALASLARVYALQGNWDKASPLIEKVKSLEQRKGNVFAYDHALMYLALGDKSQAIDWLARSYEARESGVIGNIGVDPMLDSLRGDPRFEALVHKVIGPKAAEKR